MSEKVNTNGDGVGTVEQTPPSCEALRAEQGEDEYVISLRANVM